MSEENSEMKSEQLAEPHTSLEKIAPSVEQAITSGLAELGVREDQVDVEVLDEGTKGVFGLGSRQARVRLTIKTAESIIEEPEPEIEREQGGDGDGLESGESDVEVYPGYAKLDIKEEALHIARETVVDLLDRMHISAEVESYYAEPDDAHSRSPVWVDVTGKDLSVLIGHRAETLNALQYITSLIVNKELGRSIPLVVDVQGYRVRRRQEIARLANQMAEQAVKTGRRQYLEPMPANERRLVHIELRKDERVSTRSVGDEPRRKVTITPVDEQVELEGDDD